MNYYLYTPKAIVKSRIFEFGFGMHMVEQIGIYEGYMNGHLREVRRDGACIWAGTPKSRMFTFSSCLMFFLGYFYHFMLDLSITAN